MRLKYGRAVAFRTWSWCQQIRQAKTLATMTESDFKAARPVEEIPGPGGMYTWPLIGGLLLFKPFSKYGMGEIQLLYNELLAKHGPLVRLQFGGQTLVLVQDPDDLSIVMRNEGKTPRRMLAELHVLTCKKLGVKIGLGHLDGEDWYKFRTLINPHMMRTQSAQYYLPQQNSTADDLVTIIGKHAGEPQEIIDLLFKYACESISVLTFNERLGYMDPDIKPEMQEVMDNIQTVFAKMAASFRIPPFALKYLPLKIKSDYTKAVSLIMKKTEEHYKKTLNDIKRQQEEGTLNPDEHNFMLSLVTKEKLSVEEMGTVAYDLFTAGTDSTARNLQIVLYTLARNPEKQEKLYHEILAAMGPDGELTAEALSKMPYLVACVRESFRLRYPIQSGTQRFLQNDIVLRGYQIPTGTSILMMNHNTVKDEKYFPNPEEYIPERWLRDDNRKREHPIPPTALLPFGFGPRMCLGKRFAEQEIYLAVVKVLQKFHIKLEPGHEEIELVYKIFAGTKRPVRFVFEKRT